MGRFSKVSSVPTEEQRKYFDAEGELVIEVVSVGAKESERDDTEGQMVCWLESRVVEVESGKYKVGETRNVIYPIEHAKKQRRRFAMQEWSELCDAIAATLGLAMPSFDGLDPESDKTQWAKVSDAREAIMETLTGKDNPAKGIRLGVNVKAKKNGFAKVTISALVDEAAA